VTAETAILLGRELGMSAEFWMNLQTAWDLYHAQRRLKAA
jgi:antitoxin HigA-1